MNMRQMIAPAAALVLGVAAFAPAAPSTGDVLCRVDLDRDVLPADQNQTTVIKVSLDAPPPPKTSILSFFNSSLTLSTSAADTPVM